MPRHTPLSDWTDRVTTAFPDLPPAHARLLAEWSYGLILARGVRLVAVTLLLAALVQWLREAFGDDGRVSSAPAGDGGRLFPTGRVDRKGAVGVYAFGLSSGRVRAPVADPDGPAADSCRHAFRSWIEQGFRLIERVGGGGRRRG